MPRPRTGSAFKHGDHWDIRITLPDGTRSKSLCLPGKTEAQARAEAARLTELAEKHGAVRADAGPPKGPALTIAAIVDRWCSLIAEGSLAPATKSMHLQNARGPILARFGALAPEQLTTGALRGWLREVKARLSPSRTRQYFFSLSKMLDDAAAEDWITAQNPCRHPKVRDELPAMVAPDDDEKAHHTEQEAKRLILATKAPERRVRYVVALTTGMRDGEIAGLRWCDVGEEKGVLVFRIRGAIARQGDTGWATRRATKTAAGRRLVPLHPSTARVIKAWREHGWAAYVGRPPTDEDPLLPAADGSPWRPRSSHFLRLDLEAAELPTTFDEQPFEFRSTRRSFATWLESHDVSGELIDRLLGHAGTSVRRKHYAAANLDALLRAVSTIELELGDDEASDESSKALTERAEGVPMRADRDLDTPAFQRTIAVQQRAQNTLKTGGGASLPSASEARITRASDHRPPSPEGRFDDSPDETTAVGPADPLERALVLAAEAGRFDVVAKLADELHARRVAAAGNVVAIEPKRGRR